MLKLNNVNDNLQEILKAIIEQIIHQFMLRFEKKGNRVMQLLLLQIKQKAIYCRRMLEKQNNN